ncbi:MAG: pyruvate kinase [Armatimonadota bacterium]|nr:pyruvate kinase [Armatimonadota bacterium]MCX7778431.1 pyruvate kinase [Armatimonadota bacterium]MDW8025051.1 pyruvate kinase [Armatimonadota bacterium]
MRCAKIICTIGPATLSSESIEQLIHAGMDVARINCSHGTVEQHIEMIRLIREASYKLGKYVAILFDLRGPRMRVGDLREDVELHRGDVITLVTETHAQHDEIPIQSPYLAISVRCGQRLLIDDGRIELVVKQTDGARVRCEVIRGGVLKSRKGINVPGVRLAVPIIEDDELDELSRGVKEGVDFIGASFVRSGEDVHVIRSAVQALGGRQPIIAKLEHPDAIANLNEILEACDGVMVARGDLGVEMLPEDVPMLQKQIIAEANKLFKPVIVATQMLESMTESPRPTRAEASDVANAILDGADALMLSGETAIGDYPIEATQMMDRLIRKTEGMMWQFKPPLKEQRNGSIEGVFAVPRAVSSAACVAAEQLDAKAIVVFTQSGSTALLVSKYRPRTPIVAFTPYESVCRFCSLLWGVVPQQLGYIDNTDELVRQMDERLLSMGFAKHGDIVIMVAGIPLQLKGRANFVKVHIVGEA